MIIATYNRAHLLDRAIESVLAQTYKDFELIVIDDGSTDATKELMARYEGQLRFLQHDHRGKSMALNCAIDEARGEWIALLDSDDYWLPEKLQWQIEAVDTVRDGSCGACFTNGRFINNPAMSMSLFEFYGRKDHAAMGVMPRQVEALAASSAGVSVVALLCRADLARQAGCFDPELAFTEDYDFVFRLSLLTPFCFVNKELVIIDRAAPTARHTGTSAVWDRADFRLQCEQYRCEKWMRLVASKMPAVQSTIRRRLRCIHSAWANWYLLAEDYAAARKHLSTAARYEVTPAILVKRCVAYAAPALTRAMVLKRQPENPDPVM